MAGAVMVHAAAAHPDFVLRAAADPHQGPREAFARDHNARAYADVQMLVARSRGLGRLYRHAAPVPRRRTRSLAAEHGKHIILEKPMALTLADCDAIIAAVERHKVHLIVGHTHAFDPAVRLMRDIIARGELGRLGLIHSFNYTNYLYRPRRPEELDTAQGGGILFNQVPHQIDTARLLAGGIVRSVRASTTVLDPSRPTEASCAALLQFDNGAAASLVYSGYDHFDSDEWHFGIGERGAPKQIAHGARPPVAGQGAGRSAGAHRDLRLWRGQRRSAAASAAFRRHHRHLRRRRHARLGRRRHRSMTATACATSPIPRGGSMPGRREVLDDMRMAIRSGDPPVHDGRWGKANVEVALAILQSAREGREVALEHQVAVPDGS